MDKKGYALVTGATGGLGKAFVYVLAERGDNLLLTGRSEEKLVKLQAELQEKYPQIEVRIYPADLSNEASRYAMMEKIAFQCRVNFEAAVSMCHFAIAHKAERLEIVNVSSVSGIYPMPYFAIYSATKGALTSFSQSLRAEMKGKNVAVTAILPGAMPTRDDIKEQIKGQGLWGKLAAKTPEAVAKASLKAVRKNKRKVIVGFWNKLMRIGTCWLPTSWRLKFIANRWSKISKDAF